MRANYNIKNCKDCNYSDEFCASGDCPNNTSLTEQWKKGKLLCDWYYTKLWKGCIIIDKFIGNQFIRYNDSDIVEVITKVPSYEEWQTKLKENAQLRKRCEEFNALNVAKENQQLKELLKECKKEIDKAKNILTEDTSIDNTVVAYAVLRKLLIKINNTIGAKR